MYICNFKTIDFLFYEYLENCSDQYPMTMKIQVIPITRS